MSEEAIDFSLLLKLGAKEVTYKAGDTIFTVGDEADELYIIEQGEVDIRLGNRLLATLDENAIFGEMALIDDKPRSATAVAADRREARAGLGEAVSVSGQPHALLRAARDARPRRPPAHVEHVDLGGADFRLEGQRARSPLSFEARRSAAKPRIKALMARASEPDRE